MTAMTNTAAATSILRDIRPPVAISSGWAWLGWGLAALALAAAGFLAWRLWRRGRAPAPAAPSVPPHVRARQQLEAALALLSQPYAFCSAVSDTIRWYLEERFDFHAPERTTEEFLHELRGSDRLLPGQKSGLEGFLTRCDLVKFAKYDPAEPELRDLHASAVRLVEETEPRPAPLEARRPGSPRAGREAVNA
jgi:hypothetical protein